jgi:excisionase family DNA binding protein
MPIKEPTTPFYELDEITTAQAAEILDVSTRAVLQMIESGRLKTTRKLPGKTGPYLLSRDSVEQLAKERLATKPPSVS